MHYVNLLHQYDHFVGEQINIWQKIVYPIMIILILQKGQIYFDATLLSW